MNKVVSMIIADIITTVYESFGVAFFLSSLFIFCYFFTAMLVKKSNKRVKLFLYMNENYLKMGLFYVKLFLLVYYIAMVLYRTLLSRNEWPNPLSNVMGGWWVWELNPNGVIVFTTECFENFMLMLPFTVLWLWMTEGDVKCEKINFYRILWNSLKAAFLFSITIECLQLFLRLGTFQISDIVYNTFGGGIGGGVFFCCHALFSFFAVKRKV